MEEKISNFIAINFLLKLKPLHLCSGFSFNEIEVNKKALYAILIALIVPLVIFLYVNSLPKAVIPHPVFYDSVSSVVKNGKQKNDTFWHHIPDFKLTNQFGKTVSFSDLRRVSQGDTDGRIVVADFFYTHCPTICPVMTRNDYRTQ